MSKKPWQVFIGFDPREAAAFSVARESIRRFDRHVPINGLVLSDLQARKLYYRPTTRRMGRLWDEISGAWMSTEFANSRFLVPEIAKRMGVHGWAIFMDCDMLVRRPLVEMIGQLDDDKALYCVQHDYVPLTDIKMDGQRQESYARKNWSSVMAINIDHEANDALTVEIVNTLPGRDLHKFCWLKDSDIGALDPRWNYLLGEPQPKIDDPAIVHFTLGGPWFQSFENVPYADEWRAELCRWAA
jgi:hypothetical protein